MKHFFYMKLKTIIIIIGMLLSTLSILAQKEIPLKIGDTVPDLVLHNVINYKDSVIRISDFKDKLVILDFWSIYCGGCIKLLPYLDFLQKAYKGKVQIICVSPESIHQVNHFLINNNIANKTKLVNIASDTILDQLFPHQLISHEVWIGKNRKVLAITYPDYIDSTNIELALSSQKLGWPVKTDNLAFDDSLSLLTLMDGHAAKQYTLFLPYQEGIPNHFGSSTDTVTHKIRSYMYNMPLAHLFLAAWGRSFLYFQPSHIKVDPQYLDRIVYVSEKIPKSDWDRNHTYCYESLLPDSLTGDGVLKMMRHSLEVYSGFTATLTTQQTDCLVLQIIGDTRLLFKRSSSTGSSPKYYIPKNLDYFIDQLNLEINGIPVLNETGIKEKIQLSINMKNMQDTNQLNIAIAKYGLKLIPAKRNLELLIIKPQKL